ncbi:MAG: glycoside hydrolase family 13 protein [Chloroflexota bacterium]
MIPRRARVARIAIGLLALGAWAWPASAAEPPATLWRGALATDGTIRQADLRHDSQSDLCRAPTGAVPAGSTVLLRLRAAAGDLGSAQVRLTDRRTGVVSSLPMEVVGTDPAGGEHGYDYWQARIDIPDAPTILDYWFVVADGASRRYLADDQRTEGGTGAIGRTPPDGPGWQLTAYDPGFATPAWTRGAVVYQAFPDRFADGDPANDPSPDATPGTDGPARYVQGEVYGNPILAKGWAERPEGYCRAYQGPRCDEAPLGRDFFGGDLRGLTAHLDDLVARGVTAIYLNPIFAAPSNHRYDTSDYFAIDPDLGTDADLDALIAAAHARDIKVILDGVFNHVSSDSPWFDRMGRYDELGACESADSPYRDWFTFRAPGPGQPAPCAPSVPGGDDTYYESWAGFDTIPALRETPAVIDLITGEDGVIRHWLRRGIDGWRLDVANDLSPAFLRAIRQAARAEDPDALIIAEEWNDSSAWLLGDQAVRPWTTASGGPSSASSTATRRTSTGPSRTHRERLRGCHRGDPRGLPAAGMGCPAPHARLPRHDAHPVDPHARRRRRCREVRPGRARLGLQAVRLASALQLTMPGMASVYYGDEVGLSGQDDPDDRRPYPWGAEDAELLAWYTRLAGLRQDRSALRDGDLAFLGAEDAVGALAYLRRSDDDAALIAVNVGEEPWTLDLDVAGRLPEGLMLDDALADLTGGPADPAPVTVVDGRVRVRIPARGVRVLMPEGAADLTPPPAPARPHAETAPGRVALAWEPVADATRYQVWRSPVSGGGYVLVGDATEPAFVDAGVANGALAHHVVTALEAAGNVSARSGEVASLPRVTIAAVVATGEQGREAPVSLTGLPVPVTGIVTLDGGASTDPASGIRAQVGLRPAGTDPAGAGWVWTDAAPDVVAADRWVGGVRPEEAGTFATAVRASSDGGRTWTLSGSTGRS